MEQPPSTATYGLNAEAGAIDAETLLYDIMRLECFTGGM